MKRPSVGFLAFVVALGAGLLLPLYFALISSVRAESTLFGAPSLWPGAPTLEHYRALFSARHFWTPIGNSLVVASATTALSVVIGSAAAYALARLAFRAKRFIVGAVLAVSMFPQISTVPPLYLALRELGLIDTYPGLVLPYLTFALPLTIWLLYAHLRELPKSLEEAAQIDGASRLAAFFYVILPLALPGIATTAILTFVYCWNEFLFALAFTLGPEHRTVPVAIALLSGRHQVPWGQVLAASVVATLPVALVVLAFQRRIVRSFAPGGR
jgi:trehalose/maltose transport system permease protein